MSRVDADGHLAWHIARQVSRGGGYEFQAIIQPLYIVSEVMVSNVREDLGRGRPGTRSFFTEDTPDDVPVDEIGRLFQRFALPHFARYGTDLASFLKLTGGIARARPQRRGTWTTEAWTAGALTLLGDWRKAKRAWSNCLLELSQFDDDLAPELRKLAGQAVDANDRQERGAVFAGWR